MQKESASVSAEGPEAFAVAVEATCRGVVENAHHRLPGTPRGCLLDVRRQDFLESQVVVPEKSVRTFKSCFAPHLLRKAFRWRALDQSSHLAKTRYVSWIVKLEI